MPRRFEWANTDDPSILTVIDLAPVCSMAYKVLSATSHEVDVRFRGGQAVSYLLPPDVARALLQNYRDLLGGAP